VSVTSSVDSQSRKLKISVVGRFDFTSHEAFRHAYEAAPKGTGVSIDLRRVEYMDSSALGMLLLLKEHVGGDAHNIGIEGPRPEILSILKVACFDKLFRIRS
jgi:anti-anti-sigma factor